MQRVVRNSFEDNDFWKEDPTVQFRSLFHWIRQVLVLIIGQEPGTATSFTGSNITDPGPLRWWLGNDNLSSPRWFYPAGEKGWGRRVVSQHVFLSQWKKKHSLSGTSRWKDSEQQIQYTIIWIKPNQNKLGKKVLIDTSTPGWLFRSPKMRQKGKTGKPRVCCGGSLNTLWELS